MNDEQNPRPDAEPGDGQLLTEDAPGGSADGLESAAEPTTAAGQAPRRRRWSRRLTTVAVTCGLVIGAVGLTWEVEEQRDRDQQSLIVAEQERLARLESVLTAPDAITRRTTTKTGIRLSTVFSPEHHAAVVTYAGFPEIGLGRTYQLWRVRNDKTKSMRVLAPDARAGTAMVLNLSEGDAVAFTVEPEGGSGQPTGDVVVGLPLT